jgi:hypothetical protein
MTNAPITTPITELTGHSVHTDPIDAAIAALADASLADRLVCDGSCNGVASCTVAPVEPMAVAA